MGLNIVQPGDVAADVLFRLGLTHVIVSIVAGSISMFFYARFNITEEVHKNFMEQLQKKQVAICN